MRKLLMLITFAYLECYLFQICEIVHFNVTHEVYLFIYCIDYCMTDYTTFSCLYILWVSATSVDKNNGTNDKFYRKVAILMYTQMFNLRPQS